MKTILTILLLISSIPVFSQIKATVGDSEIEKRNNKDHLQEFVGELNGKIYFLAYRLKPILTGNSITPKLIVYDLDMNVVEEKEISLPKDYQFRALEKLNNELLMFLSTKKDNTRNIFYQKLDTKTFELTGDLINIGAIDFQKESNSIGEMQVKVAKTDDDKKIVIHFKENDVSQKGVYACIDEGELIINESYELPESDYSELIISDLKITEFPKFAAIYRVASKKVFTDLTFYLGKFEGGYKIAKIESESGLEMEDICILNTQSPNIKLVGVSKHQINKKMTEIQNLITYEFGDSKLVKIDEVEVLSLVPKWEGIDKPYVGVYGEVTPVSEDFSLFVGKIIMLSLNVFREIPTYEKNVFDLITLGIDSSGKILWKEHLIIYPSSLSYEPYVLFKEKEEILMFRKYADINRKDESIKGNLLSIKKSGISLDQNISCTPYENMEMRGELGAVRVGRNIYTCYFNVRKNRFGLVKVPVK